MAERRRRSGLAVGLVLVGSLGVLALSAPWIATDRPWIARRAGEIVFPAFASEPAGRPVDRTLLRAPLPDDPDRTDLGRILSPPSRRHWLGTDALGRDLAARVAHGARVSLAVGLAAACLALAVGLPLGALAGYRGGLADALVSRLVEALLCFPTLLLVLAALSTPPALLARLSDGARIAVVIGLTGWLPVARYTRAEFARLAGSEMVLAARAAGAHDLRVMALHILPSAVAPVLVTGAFAVGGGIVVEGSLSFLGLGVQPPTATWGNLLLDAREQIDRAWWIALFPGLALFLAVLGCNLIGEGLRDRLDSSASDR